MTAIDLWDSISIVKTQIVAQPRKLKDNWTIANWDDAPFHITETKHREWKVELSGFWYPRNEVINWCKENFGPHGNNRRYKWRINYSSKYPDTVFFRDEQFVTLFVLRWSK